jgi:hypothetical protein
VTPIRVGVLVAPTRRRQSDAVMPIRVGALVAATHRRSLMP